MAGHIPNRLSTSLKLDKPSFSPGRNPFQKCRLFLVGWRISCSDKVNSWRRLPCKFLVGVGWLGRFLTESFKVRVESRVPKRKSSNERFLARIQKLHRQCQRPKQINHCLGLELGACTFFTRNGSSRSMQSLESGRWCLWAGYIADIYASSVEGRPCCWRMRCCTRQVKYLYS